MITRRSFCQSVLSMAIVGGFLPRTLLARKKKTLTLVNLVTQKSLTFENTRAYRDQVNALFPCAVTQKVGKLDPRLVTLLFSLATKLKVSKLEIASAYRDLEVLNPEKQVVGDKILHYQGLAVDIRVPTGEINTWAKAAKAVGFRGIGVMHSTNTLHLDLGPHVKIW